MSHGTMNNTMAKMWENWHLGAFAEAHVRKSKLGVHINVAERRLKNPECRKIWVRSFDEETGMPVTSKVVDIVKNGVRTTYKMVTESGKEIRATMDHQFFTPEGWKRLSELSVGDYTYRQGRVAIALARQIPPRLREGIGIWTQWIRDELIPYNGGDCYLCGEHFERCDLALDHVVPVTTDLELALSKTNLKPACTACHRKKTNGEQSLQKRMGSRAGLKPDRISSISDPIDEETYDLVLDDRHHNFVAQGLVVHNSGFQREILKTVS
jgi:thymidylate synthase (FAD)